MKTLAKKAGDWAASIFVLTGVGMLMWPFGNRHQTAREWALEAGIDLSIWLWLAAVLLVGGLCLLAFIKLTDRG